jgi:hypothetical protein
MRSFIATLLRVLALVLTILLGTLPLLMSAMLGVKIGRAARQGYLDARSGKAG